MKPTEVRITQLTPVLVAGSDALFECNTYGSRPMPVIYWMFEGRRIDTRIQGKFLFSLFYFNVQTYIVVIIHRESVCV